MKRSTVPHFVQKLDQILENPDYSDIVSWTSSGDAFTIKSVTRFSDIVLPHFFKHHNYSSFNRQLNMYNFEKVRSETDDTVYRNQHFLRDDKEQYKRIRRRAKGDNQEESEGVVATFQEGGIAGDLRELALRQYKLDSICKSLFNQNQSIITENTKIWKKINKRLDKKNKQLSALLCLLLLRSDNKQLVHSLPLMEGSQPLAEESQNYSDSSESEELREHNLPRGFNRQLISLLQNKTLNIQDILSYFADEKLKSHKENKPHQEIKHSEEANLCIKEHGEGQSQRENSQNNASEVNHSENNFSEMNLSEKNNNSIISDVNHFLNNFAEENNEVSDFAA